MFDIFDEEVFADAVWEEFSVLDGNYVGDQCHNLLPRLQATFDEMFETVFVILDRETGNPMNPNAALTKRDAAEEFLKIVGDEKYEIGILLRDR